jgi:GPH family glycoside/pentoside/hexuronide:cation symporter
MSNPQEAREVRSCSTIDMVKYSSGEATVSLVMNSIFGFAMLYYTNALGLSGKLAGIAMAVASLWDAVSDPIMGHVTDNTSSRFGRRHPYILLGGTLMTVSYFFIWYVPDFFTSSNLVLFWYLVVMNLIVRTAFTIFAIPYTALGFEMCRDYEGRSKIQGIRTSVNMAANLLGPALSWAVFFGNNESVRATSVANNYIKMGAVFACVGLLIILFLTFSTRKYIVDSRNMKFEGKSAGAFFRDMKQILTDRYPRWVFGYAIVVIIGIALVSSLQMYIFEDVLLLSGMKKTIIHGGTMTGMGLGALSASYLARRFDKKGAVFTGGIGSIFCELLLCFLLVSNVLETHESEFLLGFEIPVTFLTVTVLHGLYWFGNGIMLPIATSMMADISEIHEIRTGINKDGAYAAVYSFAMKLAMSVALFVSGYTLEFTGFVAGAEGGQSQDVLDRLTMATFLFGPLISLTALVLIKLYPVNKQLLEKIRAESDYKDSGLAD